MLGEINAVSHLYLQCSSLCDMFVALLVTGSGIQYHQFRKKNIASVCFILPITAPHSDLIHLLIWNILGLESTFFLPKTLN